jgi:16S rRNA (uracil1498-N3)-methyltransferase
MARFFLDQKLGQGQAVSIVGDDAKHIARVLRMREGESLELVAHGEVFAAELLSVSSDGVTARCTARLDAHSESPLLIHLYQALPKSDKMDLIIQKCTELGVSEITPVISSRVVVKLKDLSGGPKVERWQRIAAEAAKQCRRTKIPTVHPPLPIERIAAAAERLRLVAWEASDRPLYEQLASAQQRTADILIGPEGGLTKEEVDGLLRLGFCSVSLGPRILRTETAPLALLTILQYQLGDLGGER